MMMNNEFLRNLMVHLKYVCPPAPLSKTQAPDLPDNPDAPPVPPLAEIAAPQSKAEESEVVTGTPPAGE